MLKDETRRIAKKLDLNVAEKPDSQDICFVPNGDYVSVIEKIRPEVFKKGNIRNANGKVLGAHDGIVNFTIGQRRGIKIAAKNPLYVIDILKEKNEIIVGSRADLLKKEIYLKDLNLLSDKKIFNREILVKVRSTGKLIKSKLKIDGQNAKLKLLEDEYGISPGQACVFYYRDEVGERVLGGGWISKH
tara:strand:- start:1132 stop:1695 length:564 start_codon:yes stop_codon:yes gene_type:complete